MDEQMSSRKKQALTYALVMVSVVALVIVVAGLLRPSPEPELTTAPTTAEPDPAAPVDHDVVEEPVDPSAPIPGCDTVEDPGAAEYTSSFSIGRDTYDNPKFPWFSGPKATAMSSAVIESLPSGAELEWAGPQQSLVFQPMSDFGDSDPEPKGYTYASASLVNSDAKGSLFIQVQKNSAPIPACVAGYLDERRTMADGVVVDVHDTWQEVDKVRTLTRSAHAYAPDQSWIYASASDNFGVTQQEHSGKVPLTIDDLVRIVSDPGLRFSTPVPPGTPAPSEGCGDPFDDGGPAITREQARRLDAVLATIDLGGKLPPLRPTDSTNGSVCTSSSNAEAAAGLEVSISGGHPLPTPERPVPGSGNEKTLRTLPDGTAVQSQRSFNSGSKNGDSEQSSRAVSNSVIVTRPAGTQISITSSASPPGEPLSMATLESIALTPELEL